MILRTFYNAFTFCILTYPRTTHFQSCRLFHVIFQWSFFILTSIFTLTWVIVSYSPGFLKYLAFLLPVDQLFLCVFQLLFSLSEFIFKYIYSEGRINLFILLSRHQFKLFVLIFIIENLYVGQFFLYTFVYGPADCVINT